jgi:para-aminobenzoate synthetase component 2
MGRVDPGPATRSGADPRRILVVDNYDSFVYNLVQYLGQLRAECDVVRNDRVDLGRVEDYDGVLLSPGPGVPEEAGVCVELVQRHGGRVPVFGVCLGLQAIAVAYGGVVGRAPELRHGKTSLVTHRGVGVLAGVPDPFTATRYHSLALDPAHVPDVLEVTAHTADVVMAARHRELAVEGVQFHPESVLTQFGHRMLANWLAVCGDPDAVARSAGLVPVAPAAGG